MSRGMYSIIYRGKPFLFFFFFQNFLYKNITALLYGLDLRCLIFFLHRWNQLFIFTTKTLISSMSMVIMRLEKYERKRKKRKKEKEKRTY